MRETAGCEISYAARNVFEADVHNVKISHLNVFSPHPVPITCMLCNTCTSSPSASQQVIPLRNRNFQIDKIKSEKGKNHYAIETLNR